jgi:hypothetical protein
MRHKSDNLKKSFKNNYSHKSYKNRNYRKRSSGTGSNFRNQNSYKKRNKKFSQRRYRKPFNAKKGRLFDPSFIISQSTSLNKEKKYVPDNSFTDFASI